MPELRKHKGHQKPRAFSNGEFIAAIERYLIIAGDQQKKLEFSQDSLSVFASNAYR